MISVYCVSRFERNPSTDLSLRRKSQASRVAPPLRSRRRLRKIIEVKIYVREHLGQQEYLSRVHRDGKRNYNRFPFFLFTGLQKKS